PETISDRTPLHRVQAFKNRVGSGGSGSVSVPETNWIGTAGRVTQFWLTPIGAVSIRCGKRRTTSCEGRLFRLFGAPRAGTKPACHSLGPNAGSANRSRFQQPVRGPRSVARSPGQ